MVGKDNILSSATITITIDNYKDLAPPAVRITSPQNGYIIEQPQVEIVAGAGDDKGINYVEFYLDDTPLQKVFAPPYKIVFDFTPVAAGRHYLTAKAKILQEILVQVKRLKLPNQRQLLCWRLLIKPKLPVS